MKLLDNIHEVIIIVCLAPILLLPELAYSLMLRARNWVLDMVEELKGV